MIGREARDERWRAAQRALDRFESGGTGMPESGGTGMPESGGTGVPEPGRARVPEPAEEASMAGLLELLSDLPSAAWQSVPARPQRRARRLPRAGRRSLRLIAAGAVAACFGVGVVVGSSLGGGQGVQRLRGPEVVLRPLVSGAKGAALAAMPAPGHMILRVEYLRPSQPGTYYELWLMTDLHRLAPVASFRVGRSGQLQLSLDLPDSPAAYKYLDISLQQLAAGSAHSSDSVLRGPVA
jgi:hypothetical protein